MRHVGYVNAGTVEFLVTEDESFYFMGDSVFTANGVDVTYVSNLEAAFGGGAPAANDQITFARIRIRITLPATAPGGNYTVTHPYGVEVFSVAPGGGIKVINAGGGTYVGTLYFPAVVYPVAPTSDLYRGPSPLSEPERSRLR